MLPAFTDQRDGADEIIYHKSEIAFYDIRIDQFDLCIREVRHGAYVVRSLRVSGSEIAWRNRRQSVLFSDVSAARYGSVPIYNAPPLP